MRTSEALQRLAAAKGATFVTLLEHGTMSVEIYKPRRVDEQTPHDQDELYCVISGTGVFVVDGVSQPFEPGQMLFVAANVPHRFESFSDDFATWVIFWGAKGGEAPKQGA